MIKIENIDIYGWEAAIRGMRNPMNSWDKSDSIFCQGDDGSSVYVGENDLKLMQNLCKAGSDHRKFMRMINVTMDITAPLYWWKEFDTYKVGTVANSCSTMHKIHDKEFTIDDFSYERCKKERFVERAIEGTLNALNYLREKYLETKDKSYWETMIQLLPSSYNQRRTVQLNYETLLNIYNARKNHKLKEWLELCSEIEKLPYFKEITGLSND
jgi:hypothetical protein